MRSRAVLGVGVIGCATAGTVYELSGSFMGWLGWPHASVMSWAGWLFAVAILVVRGRHRTRNFVAFALLVALAIYAGEPEIFAILAVSLLVFVVTMSVLKLRAEDDARRSLRPLIDLSLAAVAGAALAAPLELPGLQVLTGSTRNSGTLLAKTEVGSALPPHDLVHLLVQGYNGLPLAGNQVFGDAVYTDTAAYVGLISVALAVLGMVRRWRRPETVGFMVLAGATMAIVYLPPIQAALIRIPLVQTIDWHRDLMIVGLCAAVLAGMGMDALVRASPSRSTQLILAGVLAGGIALLLLLWLVATSGLSPLDARLRSDSLAWPLVTGGLALLVVAGLALWTARTGGRTSAGADGDRTIGAPTERVAGDSSATPAAQLLRPTRGSNCGGSAVVARDRIPRRLGCSAVVVERGRRRNDTGAVLPRTFRGKFEGRLRRLHVLRGAGFVQPGGPARVQQPVRAP